MIDQKLNENKTHPFILRDRATNNKMPFDPDTPFTGLVTAGSNSPKLFAPYIVPTTDGSDASLSVTITETMLTNASVGSGIHILQVFDFQSQERVHEFIEFMMPYPESRTTPNQPTYCTHNDLLAILPTVDKLQTQGIDMAGFQRQREEASRWLDDQITAKTRFYTSSHHTGICPCRCVYVDPADCYYHNYTLDDINGWIEDGSLVLTSETKRIVALKAISDICLSKITANTETDLDYRSFGREKLIEAMKKVYGWIPTFTDEDGTEIEVLLR
jgi:hypothetical protein